MLLKKGMIGAEVASLVQDLIDAGFSPAGGAGNNFNGDVEAAVKAFQSVGIGPDGQPLVVDGTAGPLTRFALDVWLKRLPAPVLPASTSNGPAAKPPLASQAGWNALQIARRELNAGAGEKGGDNKGEDVMRYHAVTGAKAGDSWCASFVSYCFKEGNPGAMPFTPSAGARNVLATFKSKGWTFDASVDHPPASGDIIVWWRGAITGWEGHIGIVDSYEHGVLTTIEGNRGPYPSKVRSFTYVLGRIDHLLGFGRAVP